MGEKRRFHGETAEDGGGPAPKRHRETHDHDGGPGRFPSRGGYKKSSVREQRFDSSNWAKKRIRTIQRRLQRNPETLPANVQQDLERELSALRQQLAERMSKKQRAHMISKYHMVRFFERKKATRLEKQLRRQLVGTEDPAARARIEADLHIAEVDRLYAHYHPLLEPYISLYPLSDKQKSSSGRSSKTNDEEDEKDRAGNGSESESESESEDQEKGDKGVRAAARQSSAAQALRASRPPMWTVVEATMRAGGLEALERLRWRDPVTKEDKTATSNDGATQRTKKTNDDGKTKPGGKGRHKASNDEKTTRRPAASTRPPAGTVEENESFFEGM
ncbi:rRNA-processing protein efg1 [Niveomyces insectorum RCEF 264]|uniref:rRNA-processing protein EFG1 n=1 Tax=Niveomyces insectorum RCEF 264 TaxID=1081102 RepID=A0A167RGB4_9HYPO|nr:rRNA-processing protein efg1 [Niveomyces insectorum RCEF 264]